MGPEFLGTTSIQPQSLDRSNVQPGPELEAPPWRVQGDRV